MEYYNLDALDGMELKVFERLERLDDLVLLLGEQTG